jgi:hypothetical protein
MRLGGSASSVVANAALTPLPAFRNRFVGKADDDEGRQPGRNLNLNLYGPRLQPQEGDRRHMRNHSPPRLVHKMLFAQVKRCYREEYMVKTIFGKW